ncbi:hypothetical protein DCAR_0103013 [Daucus carota subsp. sativus]|uniref:Uncharacterized protein n=1 Tax=Daucus carota subsp. sativus TaxID=79200 RepID=A0AAF1AKW5_DAUCS|nr:PREDICTED: putative protein TPRXL [Daucus carota subsp. sativus]WOG83835.1 hypothetical protein DCAR_0103013 [Daucus carota subsp. sativus]
MAEKNQFVAGVTVGPSCYLDDQRHARRKQRFTLFNAALDMLSGSPNEKNRKNKKSVSRKDDKINGNNAEGWKKFVGSMRPLHMQATRSSSPSPRHSPISEPALGFPLSATSWGTASKYDSPNSLHESGSTGTMSLGTGTVSLGLSPCASPNNLQGASTGTTSPDLSPCASPNNLQGASTGTMSSNSSPDNLDKSTGTTSPGLSPNNIGTMSNSVSDDDLEEFIGTVSHSVSASNLRNLAIANSRRKHRKSSGDRSKLGRKSRMSPSKSTSNLQDLSLQKMRRYKSALNLHDLDLNEETEAEEDTDDKLLEKCAADVMIDVKADQFIKQFYQQMKSQHKGSKASTQTLTHK